MSPKETERSYFRVLLLHIRGAQSFQDMRTYGSKIYPTYFEAAVARKLVTNDEEWDKCLSEASSLKFPTEMCRLFAYICVFGIPINSPGTLAFHFGKSPTKLKIGIHLPFSSPNKV